MHSAGGSPGSHSECEGRRVEERGVEVGLERRGAAVPRCDGGEYPGLIEERGMRDEGGMRDERGMRDEKGMEG